MSLDSTRGQGLAGGTPSGSIADSEARASQLSAMFDGELPAAECEFVARRAARDEPMRRHWARYALIGAVVRSEPMCARRSDGIVIGSTVATRVANALKVSASREDGASNGEMPAAGRGGERDIAVSDSRLANWLRPAAGLGIAAGVAALSVFWLQAREPGLAPGAVSGYTASTSASAVDAEDPAAIEVVVAPPSLAARSTGASGVVPASREPRSYVVPTPSNVDGSTRAWMSPQLANYVVAHSEYSGPMTRRSVLSALIAAEPEDGSRAELRSETAPIPQPVGTAR